MGIFKIFNKKGLLSDSSNEINYEDMFKIINKLSENRSDIDKHYLLSLFFPEKVRNIHTIYPFPIPTYTYCQKNQIFVVPNANVIF